MASESAGTGERWAGAAPRRRRARARVALAALAALAFPALLSSDASARAGKVFQFNGLYGCTTQFALQGCAIARALRGAEDAAVSPDGRNVYVASSDASAVTTFLRARGTGRIVQPNGLRGCWSKSGLENCLTGRGLDQAWAVTVSPDGKNVYVAARRELVVFARDNRGFLEQLPGAQGCLSEDAAHGCAPARGIATGSDVIVSRDGRHVYVAGFASASVAAFARDPDSGALTQLPGPSGCISSHGADGCAIGRALGGAFGLAISRSGKTVLATGYDDNAVAALVRDPVSGTLAQLPGQRGCVAAHGAFGCGIAHANGSPNGVAITRDGKHAYVAASGADSLTTYRLTADGGIRQERGRRYCVSERGNGSCTKSASVDQAYAVAASPDARNVYLGSGTAVTMFRRKPNGTLRKIGCVAHQGVDGCDTGRALDGVTSVALSRDGKHAYATAEDSAGISAFARDPENGRIRVRIKGVPDGCANGSFRAKVRIRSRLPLRRARVTLDGARVGTSKRPKFMVRIRPGKLGPGTHRLRIRATDVTGTRDRATKRFARC